MNKNVKKKKGYYIGIDVGTTTIRACLFDSFYRLLDFNEEKINLISDSELELAEIDPNYLWTQFSRVLLAVVKKVPHFSQIISVGLCCQRNTFISWDSETLTPCHPLVTWKDGRGKSACSIWNSSLTLKLINIGGTILHFLTGFERFKAAKILKFVNEMVIHRFLATLKKDNSMQKLLTANRLAIGCMDTWLIIKLTNGKEFMTEPSSASSTGLFDPFLGTWNLTILRIIGFSNKILLPKIVDTTGINVITDPTALNGISLKLGAVLGDAQSAVFGSCCNVSNSLSISLGTGTFLDYIIKKPRASVVSGLYPLVGWRVGGESKYLIEGHANSTASLLHWAQNVGFFDTIDNLTQIAESTMPDDSLHFIPGFDGLQTPVNDERACAAFIGLKASTSREQMLHAILSAISFTTTKIFDGFCAELSDFNVYTIRCCGGLSSNNFICQQIADLLNFPIERVENNTFCAAKGAAMFAGIASDNLDYNNLSNCVNVERTFIPSAVCERRQALVKRYESWQKAQKRCLQFYN